MKKWKKISEKKILDHPRYTLFEDEVELPSGHRTTYVHLGKKLDASMVIAVRNNKVFVQKEYSYPPDEWLYQFPGGGLLANEDPATGAARELAEEGGLRAASLQNIGWFYLDNRRSKARHHVFLATELSVTKKNPDVEEAFQDFWLTPAEIEAMIKKGTIRNASMLAGWAFYQNLNKR